MATRSSLVICSLAAILTAAPLVAQGDPGQLYVRVVTMRGDAVTGFLRWDKNEGHVSDVLDAAKVIPRRFLEEAEALGGSRAPGPRTVRILGIDLRVRDDGGLPERRSGLRMGHIARLTVLDDEEALLTLHSGAQQELRRNSTDLGSGNQGILVQDSGQERPTELDWDQIDYIEFLPVPAGMTSPFGHRLYGVLETDDGEEFTGWITWDMDEIYTGDVLDGDERGQGRRRKIAFADIAKIEAASSRRSDVTLKSGETIALGGTNDVNSGNRGIAVGDPGLGQLRLSWRQFRSVTFMDPPSAAPTFDHERRLEGTVTTRDGDRYRGAIRWDNDEAWTWEFLDGDREGIEMKIEFGMIASIAPRSQGSAEVTLWDGRQFILRGSNDVDMDNNGVIVESDAGDGVLIRWRDLERIDFAR